MTTLRDRLGLTSEEDRARLREIEAAQERTFLDGLDTVERWDRQDEEDRSYPRHPDFDDPEQPLPSILEPNPYRRRGDKCVERGIDRLAQLHNRAFPAAAWEPEECPDEEDEQDEVEEVIRDILGVVWEIRGRERAGLALTPRQANIALRVAVQSEEMFRLYIAMRAAVALITRYQNWWELAGLGELNDAAWEMRRQALAFKDALYLETLDVRPWDATEYFAAAGSMIPGITAVADRLLAQYNEAIQLDQVASDPESAFNNREVRLARAIAEYRSDGSTGIEALAKKWRLRSSFLNQELRALGLTKRGGDRRK